MRRAALLLMTMGASILLASGVSLAAVVIGTTGPDTLRGTNGDDTIYGDKGNDTLYGLGGEDILGAPEEGSTLQAPPEQVTNRGPDLGKDTFMGGNDKDEIHARGGGKDNVDCGKGTEDLAAYDEGVDMVRNCERLDWTYKVWCQGPENPNGAEVLWDNADVKCIYGTKGDDTLVGRNDPDPLKVDLIWGASGDDTLRARSGFDVLAGEDGNDIIIGGSGDNGLLGGNGSDTIEAGDGDDYIYAYEGEDPQTPQTPDKISCGDGDNDLAVIDKGIDNEPADCETIETGPEDFFRWWRSMSR
jgi:Ca2+-binding RTX toxin-like protein